MVIVFFGTPQFAAPTLQRLVDSSHTVSGVVTQPDRPRGRGQKVSDAPVKALAVARHVPVFQPSRLKAPDVAETIRAWRPDLGVVAAYGRIIPDELLSIPRLGMINVHASLLPKYRGAAPVHRAVIAGEPETGVTIMRLVSELDAGPVFADVRRPIDPDETSDVVEQGLARLGADLLLRVVDQMESGTASETSQDHSRATYAPRLTKEEGLIDWSQPAAAIHNRVRGLYPWPHAYTFLNGARLIVRRSSRDAGATEAPPGTIVGVTRDAIHVATGDRGRLAIVEVQAEGRRPMNVRDFVAGHPVAEGSAFSGP